MLEPEGQRILTLHNQLMESVLGKCCAVEGTFGDATPFTSSSIPDKKGVTKAEQIADRLGMLGYQRCGNEMLYNGMNVVPHMPPRRGR